MSFNNILSSAYMKLVSLCFENEAL